MLDLTRILGLLVQVPFKIYVIDEVLGAGLFFFHLSHNAKASEESGQRSCLF